MALLGHDGPVVGRLTFEEKRAPFLLDVSSLLYDIQLLHDLGIVLWFSEYGDFTLSRYFWYRHGRPLKAEHRLRAGRIELKSPLVVELIFGSIGAVWAFTQIADKVFNWGLNRKKLQLEIEKLEAERNAKRYEEEAARARLEAALSEGEASHFLFQIAKRLARNPIRLVEIDIRGGEDE